MERSHTTLTKPLRLLIEFSPTSFPFHSHKYAPFTYVLFSSRGVIVAKMIMMELFFLLFTKMGSV